MHPPTITTISSKSSFTYKQNARILFDNETSQDIKRAPVPKPSYVPYNIPHDYRRWGWSSPTTSARWSSSLSNANLRRLSSSWRLPNPSHGRLGVAWESKIWTQNGVVMMIIWSGLTIASRRLSGNKELRKFHGYCTKILVHSAVVGKWNIYLTSGIPIPCKSSILQTRRRERRSLTVTGFRIINRRTKHKAWLSSSVHIILGASLSDVCSSSREASTMLIHTSTQRTRCYTWHTMQACG